MDSTRGAAFPGIMITCSFKAGTDALIVLASLPEVVVSSEPLAGQPFSCGSVGEL